MKSNENKNSVEILNNNENTSSEVNESVSNDNNINLKDLCYKMKELNAQKKALDKELDGLKDEFKKYAADNNIDKFEDDFVKVTLTTVDKSFIRSEEAIEYLKQHKLERYVHTKEYINDDELIMAVTRKEINTAEFSQFIEEKTEKRINIR